MWMGGEGYRMGDGVGMGLVGRMGWGNIITDVMLRSYLWNIEVPPGQVGTGLFRIEVGHEGVGPRDNRKDAARVDDRDGAGVRARRAFPEDVLRTLGGAGQQTQVAVGGHEEKGALT